MASPAIVLTATESELKDQVAKVKTLEEECKAERKRWLDAESEGQESKAKASWNAVERQLKAAQEELAALRDENKILLGQLSAPGRRSANGKQTA